MYEHYFENIGRYLSQVQILTRVFHEWGYTPALIPLLEEYLPHEEYEDTRRSFKVLDPESNVLHLRSDATLSLSKLIRAHLTPQQLPLRAYYSCSVVRPSHAERDFEMLNTGIELVGTSDIVGDFEIIALIDAALGCLELPSYKISVGSRAITNAIVSPHLSGTERAEYCAALSQRNAKKLEPFIGTQCSAAVLTIRESDEVHLLVHDMRLALPSKTKEILHALDQYEELVQHLGACIGKKKVLCNLSEVGSHHYYTGSVFSIYMHDFPVAIARGGRYLAILNAAHTAVGACGGTIFPHVFSDVLLRASNTPFSAGTRRTETSIEAVRSLAERTKTLFDASENST